MRKYHSPKDYLDAANSNETSSDELKELAKSPYDFVLTAVANNPNTQDDVLAALVPEVVASWNQQELATAIATNPNTHPNTLSCLAKKLIPVLDNGRNHHEGFRAGIQLCKNPHTPIDTIEFILDPKRVAMQFRKVVAREVKRKEILNLLSNDPSEKVRKKAVQSLNKIVNQKQ